MLLPFAHEVKKSLTCLYLEVIVLIWDNSDNCFNKSYTACYFLLRMRWKNPWLVYIWKLLYWFGITATTVLTKVTRHVTSFSAWGEKILDLFIFGSYCMTGSKSGKLRWSSALPLWSCKKKNCLGTSYETNALYYWLSLRGQVWAPCYKHPLPSWPQAN